MKSKLKGLCDWNKLVNTKYGDFIAIVGFHVTSSFFWNWKNTNSTVKVLVLSNKRAPRTWRFATFKLNKVLRFAREDVWISKFMRCVAKMAAQQAS